MHSPIWGLQEPGQPPLPSQDLIRPLAGTGRALRPLFPRLPATQAPTPVHPGGRIAGNQARSYPASNCIMPQDAIFSPLSFLAFSGHKEWSDAQTAAVPKYFHVQALPD